MDSGRPSVVSFESLHFYGTIPVQSLCAARVLDVQEEQGSLDAYLWSFVDDRPIVNHFRTLAELPAETELSAVISKALKQRGFRFVGPTVIYAFMQAVGMVDDHTLDCFRRTDVT